MAIVTTNYTTSTGSGGRGDADATYATARNNTTGDVTVAYVQNDVFTNSFTIMRYFCPVDFSSIPTNATINSATFNFYPNDRDSSGIDDTFKIILTTQASNTVLANDDYDNITLNSPTTYGTSAAYSAMTLNQYNSFALNAGAITLIQAAAGVGYVKFGFRATGDIDNSSPGTGTIRSYLGIDNSSNKIYIAVTYTIPDTEQSYSFFM